MSLGSLTNNEKKVLKNIDQYLKNISKHLKNSKYQYGLDYLFNEDNEEDYTEEPLTSNNDIDAIQETRQLFNDRRSNLSRKEINEIRKNSIKRKQSIIF